MVDRYTKGVLTVIAACLVWNIISGSGIVRPLLAQSRPVHVNCRRVGRLCCDNSNSSNGAVNQQPQVSPSRPSAVKSEPAAAQFE